MVLFSVVVGVVVMIMVTVVVIITVVIVIVTFSAYTERVLLVCYNYLELRF